jgi:hypothetical protein
MILGFKPHNSLPAVSKNAPTILNSWCLEEAVGSAKSVWLRLAHRFGIHFSLNKTAQANRKKDFRSNRPLKTLGSG